MSSALHGPGPMARDPLVVPAYAGSRLVVGAHPRAVTDSASRPRVVLGTAPRLVQSGMVAKAAAAADALREEDEDDDEWFAMFARAADTFERRVDTAPYAETLSAISGLPVRRVERAFTALAADLRRLRDIVAVQAPATTDQWRQLPAGRHVAVRVPANFPAINIEWLQAIALRRPVLLVTGERDPITAALLVESLYEAGLPEGAASLCHGDAPAFWHLADQILWPGDGAPADNGRGRVKTYHHGRSKAVLTGADYGDDVWRRLASLATRGCGRLCTNVSALVTAADPAQAAERLAEKFADYPVLPLDDPRAVVPGFPGGADQIAALIEREVAAGAIDVTNQTPLRVEIDGVAYLRPTVLLVERDSPIFGAELPFPFVTVTGTRRDEIARTCRDSLIVSVVGDDDELVAELAREPGVDKVYAGEHFDHGYDPLDPNEGYVADFLFVKKAVRR